MGMKASSGLFHGTLGSTYGLNSESPETFADRGIEVPENVKKWISQLNHKGDVIAGKGNDFSEKDVSVLSKETGVEYARVTIGGKTYLIRGDKSGTDIPASIFNELKMNKGSLDFHSHPYDNDIIPSVSDRKLMKRLKKITGQQSSRIITPNGVTATFNEYGIIETGSVPNMIDEKSKKMYEELFGGK